MACGNGDDLDQSYGDMLGVDLVYDNNTATTELEDVFVWATGGYEEFDNAIWANLSLGMSVSLLADTGYEVSLSSLGIAPYLNRTSNTQVTILDRATDTNIFEETYTPLPTDGSTTIEANATSSVGFTIFFGPDAFNAGIGSLTYDARLLSGATPVPLPATGWMLVAGLGGIAALRRRKKRAA